MLSYHLLSNAGGRKENEDSVGAQLWTDGGIFALADGLGGHGAGKVASQYVVEQLVHVFQPRHGCDLFALLSSALQEAHRGILQMQQEHRPWADMKTTAAVAAIASDQLCIAYVGDSRVYVFGKKKLVYRTLDHSVPQMLAQAGEIREKDIRHHPDRNRLLRAVGGGDIVLPAQVTVYPITDVKALLLCSDGFWEYIDERHMESALRHAESPREWLIAMERIVCKNGRKYQMDNYSAIGVFVGNGGDRR